MINASAAICNIDITVYDELDEENFTFSYISPDILLKPDQLCEVDSESNLWCKEAEIAGLIDSWVQDRGATLRNSILKLVSFTLNYEDDTSSEHVCAA